MPLVQCHYQPVNVEENDPEYTEVPEGFKIMFAGNLGEAQSLGTIVSAANKLRAFEDIKWIIIGDGRNKSWMHKKIIEYELERNIFMLGYRVMEKMPRYLSLADGLLVTLSRDPAFELTIPSKIQSYLACQKPIIGALDGEGARIIVEAEAGYVVPAEDSEKLAESVMRLYNLDKKAREQLGSNGRKYYDLHFERERLLDQLEELMSDAIKEGICVS